MTLSLSWATNASYSVGPDTGTATKVDPASAANGFIRGTVIAPQHVNFLLNAIEVALAKALDGINGGTYAMTAPLILTGTGPLRADNIDVEDTMQIRATAALDVLNNADLNVKAGGAINVESTGDINIQSGGDLTVASGGDVAIQSGGAVLVESGGQILAEDPDGIEYNAFTLAWKHSLTPHSISFAAGAPDWVSNVSTNWIQHQLSAALIIFPLILVPGDTLTSVVIRLNGAVFAGHGGLLPTKPVYTLISVDSGGSTTIATSSDAAANAAAYDVPHNTTLDSGTPGSTLPITVSGSDKYYLLVSGESGANAVADTTGILAISGNGLARTVRTNNELI